MDVCPKCKGTWLDHGELEKIRESLHPCQMQPRAVARAARSAAPRHIVVNFDVMQQVEALQHQPRA
jgi:Zn-finger nucleic acid-binding protein